jgi:hypothetical protein
VKLLYQPFGLLKLKSQVVSLKDFQIKSAVPFQNDKNRLGIKSEPVYKSANVWRARSQTTDKLFYESNTLKKTKPESGSYADTVTFWRQRHNDIANLVTARRLHLLNLQDKLNEYAQSTASIPEDDMSNKEIKILENKVDNLMIKFNEAVNIRNLYEEQVQKYKQDRLHYDKQIIQFDSVLKSKEVEYEKFSEDLIKSQKSKQELQNKYREYESRREEASRSREAFLSDIRKKEESANEAKKGEMKKIKSNEAKKNENYPGLNPVNGKGGDYSIQEDPYSRMVKEVESMEDDLKNIKRITGAKDRLLIS